MSNILDLFHQLESNETRTVEEIKQKIYDQFCLVHESWLLYGLYDYYLQTSSARCMEILVNIREPHQNYLFNKLSDSIKGSKHDPKVQALTLLGYVLRKDPPWLYKITEHQLIKDLLKFLKNENDIFLLLCALLVLVVLLPIVPSRMGQFLQDVFEIFSRLAAWNCGNPEKLVEDQMIHMQMALYALFQRLYGMYPCNFLAYLRNQYRTKEQLPIFIHTIKPMLDTVKLNPMLITASKDKETTTERWKKMGAHDVVVECERFSLDVGDRCHHEACYLTSSFRSRSGTATSTTHDTCQTTLLFLKSTSSASLAYEAKDFFSPSMTFNVPSPEQDFSSQDINSTVSLSHLHLQAIDQSMMTAVALSSQEGTSPPEAAIEATPETTPVKDIRPTSRSHLSSSSSAVRAISNSALRNFSGGSTSSTPSHSQPSSPMRKESSPFSFFNERPTSAFALPKKDSYSLKKLQQLAQERNRVAESDALGFSKNLKIPTSPLRIVNTNEFGINVNSVVQRIESPVSREDEEVLEIVKQGEIEGNSTIRQCDSVLQENEGGRGTEDDLDECEQEHGSPCTAGGLHMPNSRSVNDFRKKVRRLRFHSQCANESEVPFTSTGSSPGNCQTFVSDTVRRASSCPEIKKSSVVPTKDNRDKILLEADEDINKDGVFNENKLIQKKEVRTIDIQTENYWPLMPYEHLFLGLFPSMEINEVKPSPIPSPAPTNVQDKFSTSPYEIIDKYIDLAVNSPEKDIVKSLKQQLQLLHQQLLFERHRRQTHAFKNRRLLAEAKSSKVLEELNLALRDQVQLQQKDIDSLKEELERVKKETQGKRKLGYDNAQIWENKFIHLQNEYKSLKHNSEKLQQDLNNIKFKTKELDDKWQHCEAALIDAQAEVQVAQEEAWAGEKGKVELEQVSKELLLSGEILLRYKEKLLELPLLKKSEQELALLKESYNNELKNLQQQLEMKTTYLEASRARVMELEDIVYHNEDSSISQKRVIGEIKYEYDEKLKAITSKYKNQIALNRSKDEVLLELWSRIETTTNQRLHSPDISSCHEVQAVVTDKSNISGLIGDNKESTSSSSKT